MDFYLGIPARCTVKHYKRYYVEVWVPSRPLRPLKRQWKKRTKYPPFTFPGAHILYLTSKERKYLDDLIELAECPEDIDAALELIKSGVLRNAR